MYIELPSGQQPHVAVDDIDPFPVYSVTKYSALSRSDVRTQMTRLVAVRPHRRRRRGLTDSITTMRMTEVRCISCRCLAMDATTANDTHNSEPTKPTHMNTYGGVLFECGFRQIEMPGTYIRWSTSVMSFGNFSVVGAFRVIILNRRSLRVVRQEYQSWSAKNILVLIRILCWKPTLCWKWFCVKKNPPEQNVCQCNELCKHLIVASATFQSVPSACRSQLVVWQWQPLHHKRYDDRCCTRPSVRILFIYADASMQLCVISFFFSLMLQCDFSV